MKFVYAGGWGFKNPTEGIRRFVWKDGILSDSMLVSQGQSLAIQTIAGNHLFSVQELGDAAAVYSYAIQDDGTLQLRDVYHRNGWSKLSYVSVHPEVPVLFVSSMEKGTVDVYSYDEEGKLTLESCIRFTGHGPTPRQSHAAVHSVFVSPDGNYVLAQNLGADEIEVMRFDRTSHTLELIQSVAVDAGGGPRHLAFTPDGSYVYLLTEQSSRIYAYRFEEGRCTILARYEAYDTQKPLNGMSADIVVSHKGKYLYASNRGQNNVSVWKIRENGLLDLVGFGDVCGEGPRGLCLNEEDTVLFSANHDDDSVTALAIGDDGMPQKLLAKEKAAGASCVRLK